MTIETLHPGIYTRELAQPPTIVGVSTSTGGFVGRAERGRTDEVVFLTSFAQFQTEFGNYLVDSYLADSVKAFFDNGGQRCYVGRVVGSGAAKATLTLDAFQNKTTDALEFTALGEGAYGNGLSVQSLTAETQLAADTGVGVQSTITVKSTRGFNVGDVIIIDAGGSYATTVIKSINFTTKVFTLLAPKDMGGSGFPTDTYVRTGSMHRWNTTLAADLANGATEAVLTDGTLAQLGQIVSIGDGTNAVHVVITSKNGNTIGFSSVVLPADIVAANSVVVSQEFQLTIYDGGVFSERHDYLSMEATNNSDYVENRLGLGVTNESKILSVTDEAPAVDLQLAYPYAPVAVAMTGGLDGGAPADGDYIGTVSPRSGLHMFDVITDVNMLAIPGVTTQVVQSDLIDYCELRADVIGVLSTPLAVDETEEAREHKQVTLNKNSSYYALYYPWIITKDPFDTRPGSQRRRSVPPDGFIMGEYAETDAQRGVHKAPANTTLRGALGLTAIIEDADQDILNPIGVNCIRIFPGEGVKVFGARTGWSVADGFHYVNVRRLVNFVKVSVKEGLRFVLFEPIQPDLYDTVQGIISEFLGQLWSAGALYPSDDMSQAFFVRSDGTNNTETDRQQGKVNVDVGINPPYPAEFVLLTISIWDGGARFEENVA